MKSRFFLEAHKIWTEVSGTNEVENLASSIDLHKKLLNIFQAGDYYYFIFNIRQGNFEFVSPEIGKILGLDPKTITAREHLANMHPEDMPYFLNFENKGLEFFRSIPVEKIPKYKIRYDFRLSKPDGTYIRLLHQMVFIQHDKDGNLLRSLGVHTDITDLKPSGRPMLSFIGLEGEPSFVNVAVEEKFKPVKSLLSDRETDVLLLLSNGLSSQQIADRLNISIHTVNTHRKNILRKTDSESTYETISKSIAAGWI